MFVLLDGRADDQMGRRADGRTGGQTNGRADARTGGRADGRTSKRKDERTDGLADGRNYTKKSWTRMSIITCLFKSVGSELSTVSS